MPSLLKQFVERYMREANPERYRRGEDALTWAKFARESGIAQATVYRIKEYDEYRPGYDVLEQIAQFTGEDVHKLFDMVMGVDPRVQNDALKMSEDSVQLSDTNRDNLDKLLIEVTSGQGDNAKGIALLLLSLQQSVDQLAKEVALLRGQLHE